MADCADCGAELFPEYQFCRECGAAITPRAQTCEDCSAPMRPGDRFCEECGREYSAAIPAAPPPPPPPDDGNGPPMAVIWATLAVMAVAMGAIVTILLLRGSDEAESPDPTAAAPATTAPATTAPSTTHAPETSAAPPTTESAATTAPATTTTAATTTSTTTTTTMLTTTTATGFLLDPPPPYLQTVPGNGAGWEANGSGCVAPLEDLPPDGTWFGFIIDLDRDTAGGGSITFDMGCFYEGAAAASEAAFDGEAGTGGIYVRNKNPHLYRAPVAASAAVFWIDLSGYHREISFRDWPVSTVLQPPVSCVGIRCSVWITVRNGRVFEIQEQLLP